jgi:hypothetical protein
MSYEGKHLLLNLINVHEYISDCESLNIQLMTLSGMGVTIVPVISYLGEWKM